MKKPLIPILVVATTSLAVASVQFARQASSERERADTEVSLRQQQAARITQLEQTQARLEREINTLRAAADAGPALTAGAAAPRPAPPPRAEPRGGAGFAAFNALDPNAPPRVFSAQGARPAGPGFMETEAGRKFMQTRMKMGVRRMHADVGEALGLPEEKTNELLDLLADQQARLNERFRTRNEGQVVDPRQAMQESQAKNNAEIAALIGQDKIDEWESYQKSLPDRTQVSNVNQQLTDAGVKGLSDDQRRELLAAFTEERQNLPRPEYNSGLAPEEQIAQSNQWQADYEKAMLARAKSVLSSEQYRAYKEYADFQSEMRKSLPRMGAPGAMMRVQAAPMVLEGGATVAPTMGAAVTVVAPPPTER